MEEDKDAIIQQLKEKIQELEEDLEDLRDMHYSLLDRLGIEWR